jgi:hypothetical protein
MAASETVALGLAATVEAIRERVKARRHTPVDHGSDTDALGSLLNELVEVRRHYEYLYQIRTAVERMPPNPGTLRARFRLIW